MAIENILSQEIVQKLGWTLVHFVWQAAVVTLLLAVVLRLLRKSSANLRYVLACLALALMVLAPVMTIRAVSVSAADTITAEPAIESAIDVTEGIPIAEMVEIETPLQAENAAASPRISWRQRAASAIEPALPYVVFGWLMGVLGLSVWHLGGWTQLQRLRRRMVKPVNASLHSKLKELAELLGINRAVELAESALVGVPTVVGWLKPVILLPASALTGLSTEQLEAILAHELAHIKRGDYLVNILQTVVEILGFYHPAVWWVSHKIRLERENCCDDLAVSIRGDRVGYARALTSMAEIRAGYGLAVAAAGGNLFERICRLIGKDTIGSEKVSWIPSVTVLTLVLALLIPTTLALSSGKNEQIDVKNDRVRVYQVNRNVSDFPEIEDFSTPESAYAAINRVMAAEDHQGWQRVSVKRLTERLAKDSQVRKKKKADPEWSRVVLNARILEVRIKDDIAAVIAKFPQAPKGKSIREPVDYRHLELEDGKWLNTGEDRYDSIEQAREKFAKMVKKQLKAAKEQLRTEQIYSEMLDKPEILLGLAEELFYKLRKADYEKVLSYYNEKTGRWRRDGWKKLGLDYMVRTDWPSFAVWVCRTFKDNPIESVEVGKVFISDKEVLEKIKAPAVSYKLVLQDGGILDGDLYFVYWDSSGKWQAAKGIDWHLQENPIKKAAVQAGFEESAARLRVEELEKRVESAGKLHKLGNTLLLYASDNQDKYPDSLKEIKSYLRNEQDFQWAIKNVEYPGKGKSITISPYAVIAYDKTLLEKGEGTNVLYNDCHVAFEKPKQLEKLGIKPDVQVADDAKAEIQVNVRVLLVPIDANEFNNFFEEESLEAASININGDPNLKSYFLDDEQTQQLLKLANTTHGFKMLTGPEIKVIDGEEATMRCQGKIRYTSAADNSDQPEVKKLPIGTTMIVKPTLEANGEKILLEVDFEHTNLLGFIEGLPQTEITRIKTRVLVPNGGTLLLGGQKMTTKQDGQEVLKTLFCLVKAESSKDK